MIVYKEADKFRAELYKHMAYFFASISGLMVIRMAVYGDHIIRFCNLQGLTAIVLLITAYIFANVSLAIYADLDYKVAKSSDKINTKEVKHG